MNPLLLGLAEPIARTIGTVLDKLFPDPIERAKAELELVKEETKAALAQIQVNQVEASHESVFVAGWRPFVGWCCGLGFLWAVLFHPLVSWVCLAFGLHVPPAVDTDVLGYVLGGLLGLGTLRSVEKIKKNNQGQQTGG